MSKVGAEETHTPPQPVPSRMMTSDHSDTTHFRLCQQHYQRRRDLRVIPTVLVEGKRYDLRELTADQIDLLMEKGCDGATEEEFMIAGTNPKMHEGMTQKEMEKFFLGEYCSS